MELPGRPMEWPLSVNLGLNGRTGTTAAFG